MEEAQAGIESAAAGFELKVLGGRHAGAAMPLSRGSHSLGQDEECDLIFLDDAFLNGRVIVDVGGEVPVLSTTGEVRAMVDGKAVEGALELKPYQAVEVGSTRFALGPAGIPWPEPPKPAKPAETGAIPAEAAQGNAEVSPPAGGKAPKPGSRRLHALAAGGAALALAAAALVIALQPGPDHAGEARKVITALGLPEVEAKVAGGRLEVAGFVRTEAEKGELARRLAPLGLPLENKVLSAEETLGSIRQVLDIYHMEYPVEVAAKGQVRIYGVDDDSVRIREITESVSQGVQAGVSVESRIQGAAAAHAFLARMLAAKGLVHKVKVESQKGRIQGVLVTGRMSDAELADWAAIKASFKSRFGFEAGERWSERLSPTLEQFAAAARELDRDLLSVTPGDMAYISLRNGRKCFEGARLKSGPYLQSIHPDRLVLAIGSVEETYTLKKGRR